VKVCFKGIEYYDIEVDGIDERDYPDFCDAYIAFAMVEGREATEAELDSLNDDSSLVHELVNEILF
jgi:hypothetical protein